EMEQQNIKKQESINKIDTIVIIKLYKNGFYLEIINIPNKKVCAINCIGSENLQKIQDLSAGNLIVTAKQVIRIL
ncbi:MAG: hypothetical protein WCI84_02340, partial [Bacteroidota bacterium]